MQTINNNKNTYGSAFCACYENCHVTADLLGRRYRVQREGIKCLIVVLCHHQGALVALQL